MRKLCDDEVAAMASVLTSLRPRSWKKVGASTLALGMAVSAGLGMVSVSANAEPSGKGNGSKPAYLDIRRSPEERAADLISRMTLEEKAYQLASSFAPAIPRLGVQQYVYQAEAAHGINGISGDYFTGKTPLRATSYPSGLATASSWDPDLMRQEVGQISDEARGFLDKSLFGVDHNNIGPVKTAYGYLTFWAPTIELARDPRWGRNDEAYGEDPLLAGKMASAYVQGMQGEDANGRLIGKYLKAVPTAKHFALNNNEAGRMSTSSDTDEAAIRDYYTQPWRHAIEEANLHGIMTSYNSINGVPAVANGLTLNVLARRSWGFDGYVVSDCGGVSTIRKGLGIGHDWAPPGWTTDHNKSDATWTETATGKTLGSRAGAEAWSLRAGNDINCQGNGGQGFPPNQMAFARFMKDMNENSPEFVREGIDKGVLSEGIVDRALMTVFTLRMRLGEFDPLSQQPYTRISKAVIESEPHKAMAQRMAEQALVLLKNAVPAGASRSLLPLDPTKLNSVVILGDLANRVVLGSYSSSPAEQISIRQGVSEALAAANPSAHLIFDACRAERSGIDDPARCTPETQKAIASADLVLVMVGTGDNVGEARDRKSLDLSGNYATLLDQVAAAGGEGKTALLIQSAGPVAIEPLLPKAAAVLYSAANGQRQGHAAASVLFGKVNPSGHLPFTWFKDDSQLPPLLNYHLRPEKTGGLGRTYQYFTGTPTFPFGYGLSYTTFAYDNAIADRAGRADANDTISLSTTVHNTGRHAGATVVQVYADPPSGHGQLPYRLVGFQRTAVLAPGQSQRVTIVVPLTQRLRVWDEATQRAIVPNGTWKFQVATAAKTPIKTIPITVTGRIVQAVTRLTFRANELVLQTGQTINLLGKNPMLQGLGPQGLKNDGSDVLMAVLADDSFADLRQMQVAFTSGNSRVLKVSAQGLLTAVGKGTTTVSATLAGKSASVVFVVR